MKPRLLPWLAAIILISVISCSKEQSKEVGTLPAGNNFYATIGANPWNADSLQSLFEINGGISINGLSKTGDQISIVLSTFKTGVYTLSSSSDSYAFFTNILASGVAAYYSYEGSAGGTVTITSIDSVNHLLSGSFTFTLVNPDNNTSKTITQGVLNSVPYNGGGVLNPPPGNSTDTLKAMVGNSLFDAAQVQVKTASGQLVIGGITNDGKQNLELLMPVNITPGSYDLDFAGGTYGAVYYKDVSNPLIANNNGTLTITSNNTTTKTIKGTFSFNGISPFDSSITLAITNGYFSVKY